MAVCEGTGLHRLHRRLYSECNGVKYPSSFILGESPLWFGLGSICIIWFKAIPWSCRAAATERPPANCSGETLRSPLWVYDDQRGAEVLYIQPDWQISGSPKKNLNVAFKSLSKRCQILFLVRGPQNLGGILRWTQSNDNFCRKKFWNFEKFWDYFSILYRLPDTRIW